MQIKLLLMVLVLEFDMAYPEGQTERPERSAKVCVEYDS